MDQAFSLLKAIEAEPHSDDLRLIYADVLEEQDTATSRGYAEFIRAQIHGVTPPELLIHAQHYAPPGFEQATFVWRRGFVEGVRLGFNTWNDAHHALRYACPLLQFVELLDWPTVLWEMPTTSALGWPRIRLTSQEFQTVDISLFFVDDVPWSYTRELLRLAWPAIDFVAPPGPPPSSRIPF